MRAIAPRNVGRLARLRGSIRPFQARAYTTGCILEVQELGAALHLDAGRGQTIDQQALVLVLRKDQRIRERAEARAHSTEDSACHPLTGYPDIRCGDRPSALDDRVSKADLPVQLER